MTKKSLVKLRSGSPPSMQTASLGVGECTLTFLLVILEKIACNFGKKHVSRKGKLLNHSLIRDLRVGLVVTCGEPLAK